MAEPAGDPAPLDDAGFAACLTPLLNPAATGLVVAVSGGPDSTCLMGMVARMAARGALPPVAVATVDHGLRPGSEAEAASVLASAEGVGLNAHLLRWTGAKPVRALQEKARAARYGLLSDLCLRLGADHLLTAHTRDDQAETVLLRLAHGSGPAGLAGMRPTRTLVPGVTHLRPLLGIDKARLVATCAAMDWATLRDPSNEDPRFARARLRRLMPLLAAEGLDATALARSAARLASAEAALRDATDRLGTEAIQTVRDQRHLDLKRLADRPLEFTTRLIGRLVAEAGTGGPPRLDRLEQAALACRRAATRGVPLTRTLQGALLQVSARGTLAVTAEPQRSRGRRQQQTDAMSRLPLVGCHDLGNGGADPYIAR